MEPWCIKRFGLVCVVWWHLASVRTFSVMYDHTFSKLANHQIRHQATQESGLSAWWLHMVTLIFLRGLCGYNGLTYSRYNPSGVDVWKGKKQITVHMQTCLWYQLMFSMHDVHSTDLKFSLITQNTICFSKIRKFSFHVHERTINHCIKSQSYN